MMNRMLALLVCLCTVGCVTPTTKAVPGDVPTKVYIYDAAGRCLRFRVLDKMFRLVDNKECLAYVASIQKENR